MNAEQLDHVIPEPMGDLVFNESSSGRSGGVGCGWGHIDPVDRKLAIKHRKFRFGWEKHSDTASLYQRGLIPEGCIPIIVWIPLKETGFWDQFLGVSKFQCLRDEFQAYPSAPTKKYILMGLPGNRREHDGVIMDLIHDSFIPWE